MARRDKSTDTSTADVSAAVMPTDTEYTELPYEAPDADFDPDDQETIDVAQRLASTPAKPRLIWNAAMDDALVSATRTTTNGAELVSLLQRHDAFADLPASVITQGKIGNRLSKLRKAGVDVPKLKAPGGYFGPKYTPDVERLNRLLKEPVPASTPADTE